MITERGAIYLGGEAPDSAGRMWRTWQGVCTNNGNGWVMLRPGDLAAPLADATIKEIEEAVKRITEPRQYPDGVTIAYEEDERVEQRLFVWFYIGFTVGIAWYPKHREVILSLPFVTIQYKWGN